MQRRKEVVVLPFADGLASGRRVIVTEERVQRWMLSECVRFEMVDVEILEREIAGEELGKVVCVMSLRLPILLLPMIFLLSACVCVVYEELGFRLLSWGVGYGQL
jgi:hypothetical protein